MANLITNVSSYLSSSPSLSSLPSMQTPRKPATMGTSAITTSISRMLREGLDSRKPHDTLSTSSSSDTLYAPEGGDNPSPTLTKTIRRSCSSAYSILMSTVQCAGENLAYSLGITSPKYQLYMEDEFAVKDTQDPSSREAGWWAKVGSATIESQWPQERQIPTTTTLYPQQQHQPQAMESIVIIPA